MKKNKKSENKAIYNMAIFVIVVIILFMSIVCVDLIMMMQTEKSKINNLGEFQPATTKKSEYNTDKLDFIELVLSENETYINDLCQNGCNISVDMYDMDYQYIIQKQNNNYILNVVKDGIVLLSDKNLGSSVKDAYFRIYTNNIFFYNNINSNKNFDYGVVVDKDSALDEFTSSGSGEFILTTDSIIYYYDTCNKDGDKNALKIKAIRSPFTLDAKTLATEKVNYEWCK